jgi:hypothetical protein
MEYRGKEYTVVQGIEASWNWNVHLDEKTIRSGTAPTRAAAINRVIWEIDKALDEAKRVRLRSPPYVV